MSKLNHAGASSMLRLAVGKIVILGYYLSF